MEFDADTVQQNLSNRKLIILEANVLRKLHSFDEDAQY